MKPDGIVLHPTDWLFMQLAKTTTKEYLGSGPFAAPALPTLWGVSVAVTPVIAAGTALVGVFGTAAQVFTKGGVRVGATDAHQDYFIKNLVAIRAEIRALLATYVPAAFGKVTGLVATPCGAWSEPRKKTSGAGGPSGAPGRWRPATWPLGPFEVMT